MNSLYKKVSEPNSRFAMSGAGVAVAKIVINSSLFEKLGRSLVLNMLSGVSNNAHGTPNNRVSNKLVVLKPTAKRYWFAIMLSLNSSWVSNLKLAGILDKRALSSLDKG